MPTVAEKRRTFRALHVSGCFVIPNPWDVGSARYLQHLGFKALATTSSGAAWSLGFADGELPLGPMLDHIRALANASDIPVNVDFGNGFADEPDKLAENVRLAVATGVAGLSIEDQIPGTERLYDFGLAVERIAAARAAIDGAGGDALLVARSECYLTGHAQPLKEAILRLQKFAEVGADCLFAPGVRTRDDIRTLVEAVAPKPVNVLIGWPSELTVDDLASLGVRRISVGGALARSAWGGFIKAAKSIAGTGSFAAFADAAPGNDLDGFFKADSAGRTR
jgi:2-methylisocitrate lyase-like PEP mutase family enzyme